MIDNCFLKSSFHVLVPSNVYFKRNKIAMVEFKNRKELKI